MGLIKALLTICSTIIFPGEPSEQMSTKVDIKIEEHITVTIKTDLTEHRFSFDYIYDKTCTQDGFYEYSAKGGVE